MVQDHYSKLIPGNNPFGLDDVRDARRTWHPTEADEKPVDAARQRVFRAIVGKAQWIRRARPDVLYVVKELSRRLQVPRGRLCGSQEVGKVPQQHA